MAFLHDNFKKKKYLLGYGDNSLILILSIFIVFFALVNFTKAAFYLGGYGDFNYYQDILGNLIIDGNFQTIVQKPWTLLTYMFVYDSNGFDAGILMASNLLWLWLFGYVYQNVAGNEHVFPTYLYGGILGGFIYIVFSTLFPHTTAIAELGGTIPTCTIAIATLVMAPKAKLFSQDGQKGVPLIFFVIAFFVIIIALQVGKNHALIATYIFAGLIGFLYSLFLKTGTDLGSWMGRLYYKVIHLFEPKEGVEAKNYIDKDLAMAAQKMRKENSDNNIELYIDEILEKVIHQGIDSLTPAEKAHLDKQLT